MGVGGIGGGAGHIGAAQSTRSASALSNLGGAAFGALMDVGTVAAGALGGPSAASAVGSLRSLGGSSLNPGSGSTSSIVEGAVGDINANKQNSLNSMADQSKTDQSFQADLFQLQSAMNSQSQTNNMISGMQKARHDSMMATIRNIQ